MKAEVAEGAVMSSGLSKTTPVAVGGAVSGLTIFGVPIPDFVPVLTCIYMVVMICHSAWKFWHDWRKARQEEERENS